MAEKNQRETRCPIEGTEQVHTQHLVKVLRGRRALMVGRARGELQTPQ